METQKTILVSIEKLLKTEKKAGVRERIVVTAEKVFLRSGFHRISMDDLARELGMSKKTLYGYFESKEKLLRTMLERRVSGIESQLELLIGSPEPFPAKFQAVIHFVQQKMDEISPIFVEDIRRYASASFHIIEKARARIISHHFSRLMQEGREAGLLRNDLDLALLIRVLLVTIQNIVRPDVLAEMRMHPSMMVDAISHMFFEGVLTPHGRKICSRFFNHEKVSPF